MSSWFGASWGAPACDPEFHVETPVGAVCTRCDQAIRVTDQGVVLPLLSADLNVTASIAYHLDCFLKSVTNHADWEARGLKPSPGDGFDLVPESGGNILRCSCCGILYDTERGTWGRR